MGNDTPIHKYFNIRNSNDSLWFLVLIFIYMIFAIMITIAIKERKVLLMQDDIWVTSKLI